MTQTNQFQAGDIARCIDAGQHDSDLTKGNAYKVLSTSNSFGDDFIEVACNDGTVTDYYVRRFVRANQFRVGDKVVIGESHVTNRVPVGTVGTVVSIYDSLDSYGNVVAYRVSTPTDSYGYCFLLSELSEYVEVTETINAAGFKSGDVVSVKDTDYPDNVPNGVYELSDVNKQGVFIKSVIDGVSMLYFFNREVEPYVEEEVSPEVPQIKEGSRVKVVANECGMQDITIGKVYTVAEVEYDKGIYGVWVYDDVGDRTYMYTREVELIEGVVEELAEVVAQPKEFSYTVNRSGDEVYMTLNGILSDEQVAQIIEIVSK